ncbi:MAG: hypothetical protein A4E52_01508 [Pelotomaculum sp. PtaB.Bin013]|uniref:Uma2 family endonuclease n=1 Tax=Pelotomaculum isophthalicicum JI TaxID=947010 RepID=A0A9X4JVM9_9FIRM|nr:Uma2 family endonuclease [Pelotomaculum isophthalicicum]MDF9407708.1 Uma2 family endonuclease [Pelotomaculum isophthalicicum JI]OPX86426.1 MAG: hypothetical protein A4E52_01508 [Pelotomaculum sp. PtaB.Bin013]
MSLPLQEIKAIQAAITSDRIYTYEDYSRLPEGAPYQLIGGNLVLTPAPTTYHQIISMKLGTKMAGYVMEKDLGLVLFAPIDVYFENTETYQPDIIFIAKERLSIIEKEKIKGSPDLVIEILSPGTGYYDLKKKFKIYENHGVKEYWIVDPEDCSVEIYAVQEGKFILRHKAEKKGSVDSKVVTGFKIDVENFF